MKATTAKATAAKAPAVLAELTRLADIAAGIIDGEDAKRIVTEQAMHYVANPDPKFPYQTGDYYDVDHEVFLCVKKLLLRIAALSKLTVSGSVWVPVPGGKMATVALHNGVHHRWYAFGAQSLPTPPDIEAVFKSGKVRRVRAARGDKLATSLAPIRDSLGDVVAVVELTAPLKGPAPAWS